MNTFIVPFCRGGTKSLYVIAQTSLKFLILLLWPSECWDYNKRIQTESSGYMLGIKTKDS